MKAGDVYRSDFQSDMYGGQYKLVEKVPGEPNTWIIEYLPADEQTEQAILDHWAYAEAHDQQTTPIWDKTWAEGDESKGEHPQITGWRSYEWMLERDLASYAERAGTHSKVTFISSKQYSEYF
jgi:hypothetical protein